MYPWFFGLLAAATFDMADVTAGINQLLGTITGEFNIANIATIVGLVLGAVVGLFLFWWGARWVIKRISSAFTSGKLKL